jgi:hypothetical protein
MEPGANTVRDAMVNRLLSMGIDAHCVPRVLKDISRILEADPSVECWEWANRLRLLGWRDIQPDNRLMELARASAEEGKNRRTDTDG